MNPEQVFGEARTAYIGADQTAHLRRLISAFVICFLEFIISRLATSEISIF